MTEAATEMRSRASVSSAPPATAKRPAAPRAIPPPAAGDENERARSEGLRNFVHFARYCYKLAHEVKADTYIARGIEAMPAADIVAKAIGGRVYCDVIDSPSFRDRGGTYDWHPTDHLLLDHAVDGYLRSADGISTVGWTLGREFEQFGPPVTVIPNYRFAADLHPSTELRDRCGVGADDVLLLASSTIYNGFEPVIEALKFLPDNVHLATLGEIVRPCRERIHAYPAELGIENRVHFFNEVPYERLTALASGANLGLVALNPAVLNHWWSIPNRVFDYIASGLPIVTLDLPDIVHIVNGRQIGVVVTSNEADCWTEALKAALGREKEMRPRVRQAAKELVWETLEDQLCAAYGHPASVTIISYKNLVGHQRTLRMAHTLVKSGATVTICCPEDPRRPPDDIPGVRFVFTPDPVAVERKRLEDLKKERLALLDQMANFSALEQELRTLREKAAQYDQIALELPVLRDKAARFDTLAPDLATLLACVAFTRRQAGIAIGPELESGIGRPSRNDELACEGLGGAGCHQDGA